MKPGEIYSRFVDGRPVYASILRVGFHRVRWSRCDELGRLERAGTASTPRANFKTTWTLCGVATFPAVIPPKNTAEDFNAASEWYKNQTVKK